MKRLLIVKLSSIGDVLHALPVVKSIKADAPALRIGWVVRKRCAGLLRDCEFIDQVHVTEDKPSISELMRLKRELQRESYDTAFDMQGLFLSGLITWLSGAKRRVGLNRNREMNALFMTEANIEGKKPLTHALDVQRGFRTAAGLSMSAPIPVISHLGIGSADWLTIESPVRLLKRYIVMNVGASTIYKRWPLQRWIALGRLLLQGGLPVVITAGSEEAVDAAKIADALHDELNVVNLGGATSFDQLAAVLGKSRLVITGDTGPMHLAAALGIPTIALFGPTDPRLTGPYGDSHKIIWKQIACSPCFRHPTCNARVDCLTAISAEEVHAAAVEVLVGAKQETGL